MKRPMNLLHALCTVLVAIGVSEAQTPDAEACIEPGIRTIGYTIEGVPPRDNAEYSATVTIDEEDFILGDVQIAVVWIQLASFKQSSVPKISVTSPMGTTIEFHVGLRHGSDDLILGSIDGFHLDSVFSDHGPFYPSTVRDVGALLQPPQIRDSPFSEGEIPEFWDLVGELGEGDWEFTIIPRGNSDGIVDRLCVRLFEYGADRALPVVDPSCVEDGGNIDVSWTTRRTMTRSGYTSTASCTGPLTTWTRTRR